LLSIITQESLNVKSHGVYWDLKWLVGRGTGLGILIRVQPYSCVPCFGLDEYWVLLTVSADLSRNWLYTSDCTSSQAL
jgi:hypothetical protein